jgi:hypothetical protein
MRFVSSAVLFLAIPAFCQSAPATPAGAPAVTTVPVDASNPSIDYAALREDVARQNKILTDQVATARAIVKKNQELLKEAQKLQAANLKLADEKKKLEAQSVELEKQRETLKSAQKPVEPAAAAVSSVMPAAGTN